MPHTSTSLGRLAEAALQQGFADQCTLTRDSLVLVIDGRTFTFGWADGQQFLRLLLSGAGRIAVPAEREGARADRARIERERIERERERERVEWERLERERLERERLERERLERAERERAERERAARGRAAQGQAGREPERAGPPADDSRQGILRDDYLDTMLTFAERAGLIEGYDKDDAQGKVTLRTHATTTDLSFAETLEYLTSVVLDEVSASHSAATPFRRGDQPSISILPTR